MVRPASISEIDEIVSLWKEFMNDPSAIDIPIPTHNENVKRQTQFVEGLVRENPRQALVAQVDDELVGYILYKIEANTPLEIQNKLSFIYDVYVRPDHRRQGVGRGLMQACLEELRRAGPRHVRLNVWTRNEAAIRLYRRMGFTDHLLVMRAEVGG